MTEHDWHTVALVAHFIGLALGAGGATLTDVLFVSCVRHRRVGVTLDRIMETASSVVLAGYFLLLASGFGLVATGTVLTERFWAKMVMVLVVGANGVLAHVVTFPHLSRKMKSTNTDVSIGFLHQISGTAAISGVSWWMAVVAGTWKSSPWPFAVWMLVYVAALAVAVAAALVITPHVLRVDHPEFDTVFPTLAPRVQRAALVRRDKLHRIDLGP